MSCEQAGATTHGRWHLGVTSLVSPDEENPNGHATEGCECSSQRRSSCNGLDVIDSKQPYGSSVTISEA